MGSRFLNSENNIFCEIPCLTERSSLFQGLDLQKKWFRHADKRRIGDYLLKFVSYNQELLEFLGVTSTIVSFDQNSALSFRTSNYIGTIPLRSPDTGKQIGDFAVTPKFSGNNRYSDYINILNLLKQDIHYEVKGSIPLASNRLFQPPIYYEACKFIDLLDELVKSHWYKFSSIEKSSTTPDGKINWNKYSEKEYKIENRLNFPIIKNILRGHSIIK